MAVSANYEVIIIGGSYAGLSAGLALGRSMREVLIIDSNEPCNKQTPQSHNFITQDGETPANISNKALEQVLKYPTVNFLNDRVIDVIKNSVANTFEVEATAQQYFTAKKVLFATGVRDIMPEIAGFSQCWGISIFHCPYCHGYETRNQKLGIIANGDIGFHFSTMIHHWSKDLILFTNGKSALSPEQYDKIAGKNIGIIETEIEAFVHQDGKLEQVVLTDGSKYVISAVFAKPAFEQHCEIPKKLACEFTDDGYLKIDDFQETTITSVFATGDNTTMLRAVSAAVASGTKAGAFINKALIDENA